MQSNKVLPYNATITGGFWKSIHRTNAETAIFHQWDQLEQTGCIENFRIAAGQSPHFRTGFFFSDSDAYKWLDAACRIMVHHPTEKLKGHIDDFCSLIQKVQTGDGYCYTYNQIHFPGKRWVALEVEHELYCHGHLIEACISHHQSFESQEMLHVAHKAADLVCSEFLEKKVQFRPGHQEIELALLCLYEISGTTNYLLMAQQFLERRRRYPGQLPRLLISALLSASRNHRVQQRKKHHKKGHPQLSSFAIPPANATHTSGVTALRFAASLASGRYFQTHKPLSQQKDPVGHAVRFGYTMAAETRRMRLQHDAKGLPAMEDLWCTMVKKRMFVTGGLGSLPLIEGFGRDFELNPHMAYAETCAALAGLFWNWELLMLTGDPRYGDLFEWQLYNAALVGMGLSGESYFYHNPLASDGDLKRQSWYHIPCCPSNLSRVFAGLENYLVTSDSNRVFLHQYASAIFPDEAQLPLSFEVQTGFPFDTRIRIHIKRINHPDGQLVLRIPGWATRMTIKKNGRDVSINIPEPKVVHTAGGFSPFGARKVTLPQPLHSGDVVDIELHNSIRSLTVDPRVGLGNRNKAISLGPVVYCLESTDNPNLDLDQAIIVLNSLSPQQSAWNPDVVEITGRTTSGEDIILTPYFAWGNRGKASMRVFVAIA